MAFKGKCRAVEKIDRGFLPKITLVIFLSNDDGSLCKVNTLYSYVLFRMMELLLFLCLLLSALLLCLMMDALILCLTVMALQMYRAPLQQNDANR